MVDGPRGRPGRNVARAVEVERNIVTAAVITQHPLAEDNLVMALVLKIRLVKPRNVQVHYLKSLYLMCHKEKKECLSPNEFDSLHARRTLFIVKRMVEKSMLISLGARLSVR